MKKFLIPVISFAVIALGSCKKDVNSIANEGFDKKSVSAADYYTAGLTPVTLSGQYNLGTHPGGTLALTNDKIYTLEGIVGVEDLDVTIQQGTIIIGRVNEFNKPGTLVISRSATIHAVGTPEEPILFTSYNLTDNNSQTHATPGDFGGVIILGDAPVNTTATIEGLESIQPFDNGYGGADESDDSGDFAYVRIEYAGYLLSTDNEINGLTLGGVGSGTRIDHVQVSYGKDDSFEFFGGTVSCSELISLAPDDDNFDTDLGYNGTISNSYAIGDLYGTHSVSTGSDSNGIESDNNNNALAGYEGTPVTHPIYDGITIVASKPSVGSSVYRSAFRIRRKSQIEVYNAAILGYPNGFEVGTEGFGVGVLPTSADALIGGSPVSFITGNFVHAFTNIGTGTPIDTYIKANNIWDLNTLSTNSNSVAAFVQPFLNGLSGLNFSNVGSIGTSANGLGASASLPLEAWTRFGY